MTLRTRSLLLACLAFLLATEGLAQCVIKSDSVVCANDFIGFSVMLNGGQANSYAWQLGDGKTSTLADPIAQYSSFGTKNIRVTVQLKSGGSCTANKTIFVHDRPVAGVVFSSQSEYCFATNFICLQDTSKIGKIGSALAKRSILFGDGYADFSNNPVGQSLTCYSYKAPGKYPIVMEITDTKGCYSRAYDSVQVYHNASANFTYTLADQCSTVRICVKNNSQLKKENVQSFYWNFGDGHIDSVNWDPPCYMYTTLGTYTVSFVVRTGPDCVDTVKYPALIDIDPNPIIKDIPVKVACHGTGFYMADIGDTKDHYTWFYSYEGGPFDSISNSSFTNFNPGWLGDYTIKLRARSGNCIMELIMDTLVVNGPIAGIATRNGSLCMVGDTTYFCDASDYTNTYGVRRLWSFNDPVAPACTTDTKNALNVGVNCNFSVDPNPKHYYSYEDCFHPELALLDTVTLCQSIETEDILVGTEDHTQTTLKITYDKGCTGTDDQVDRLHKFEVNTCGDYLIMPDSSGPHGFIRSLRSWTYQQLYHPDGLITIGVILLGSDTSASCPGFSSGPACMDTLWFHHKLINKPEPDFDANQVCLGETSVFTLIDSIDPHIRKVTWNWGDGTQTKLNLSVGDIFPGNYTHKYLKNGSYDVTLFLENSEGCEEWKMRKVAVGHHRSVVMPPVICAGQCVDFDAHIGYYNDTTKYWKIESRRIAGKEKMIWNWGDGTTDSTTSPRHCFALPGVYNVKRTSIDSNGCALLDSQAVQVGGIHAGIRQHKAEVLCSEIVRLFDSSTVISPSTGETITDYTWDFKDGTPFKTVKEPFHFYSVFGDFTIRLGVKSSMGCTDSAFTTVKIIGPKPAFEFVTDTIGCVPLTVEMKNISTQCSHWIWYFGDPGNSTLPTKYDSNTVFTYTTPGTYYLRLYGADSIFNSTTNNKQFCSAIYPDLGVPGQIAKKVIVLPKPPADFVIPPIVCVNDAFVVSSQASFIYTQHFWDLDDGSVNPGMRSFSKTYTKPGTYEIKYVPTYPPDPSHGKACYDSAVKTIEVIDIKADFEIDPSKSGPLHLQFINTSSNGKQYKWTFKRDTSYFKTSSEVHPFHRFYPNKGNFQVCLTAINELGCEDITCKTFLLEHPKHIFIPNVFTPSNKDGVNDAFDIDIFGEESYELKIYNRYGDLVFEGGSDGLGDDGINWNGDALPAGVYYVVFYYNFYYEEKVKYTGTVTMIRD